MKQKALNVWLVLGGMVLGAFLFGWPGLIEAQGPDTTFTYQGRLLKDGSYVDGVTCNLRFGLYAGLTGGTALGTGPQTTTAPVSDGYFTVSLDFGDVFDGNPRYLETEVQCPGDAGFNTLAPRTTLYGVPYAQGVSWSDIDGMPAGFADGTDDDEAYSAGYGLNLDATNVFSVNTTQIQQRVTGNCSGQVISAINADGSVSCEADDGGISYTAGDGLDLTGTTFSVDVTDLTGTGLGEDAANNLVVNFAGTGSAASAARSDHYHSSLNASDGSPTNAVYVDGDGEVGIGTTSPGAQLDVNGNAQQNTNHNGFVKAWARIKLDGTVASCYNCRSGSTYRIDAGDYRVAFSFPVQGRPRSVTIDTLGGGFGGGEIGVADYVANSNSVWVSTYDSSGTDTNKSFTLVIY